MYVTNFLIECLLNFAFKLSVVLKPRYNLVNTHWKIYGCVHNNWMFWDALTEVVLFCKSGNKW